MSVIRFEATVAKIGSWTVLSLPEAVSRKLPSRGMTLVKGKIGTIPFLKVLEPDGRGSHWFEIDSALIQGAQITAGDSVSIEIEPSRDWPEPLVPPDLKEALTGSRQAQDLWADITPLARWDWIRWIRSTNNPETRSRRIMAACDKLLKGERRPCCFNRNLCTEPEVSRGGVLLDPVK